MSEATLIKEAIEVLDFLSTKFQDQSLILIGHSMGGAIAAKTMEKILLSPEEYYCSDLLKGISLILNVIGLFVIDVVEGTAMEALPFMENIVYDRPHRFKTLQDVVKYG